MATVTNLANLDIITEAWVDTVTNNLNGYEAAWTDYTPTTTGITVGNGTLNGKYLKIGKTIIWSTYFVLGTTSAVTGTPTFTFPFTAQGNVVGPQMFCQFIDAAPVLNLYPGMVSPSTTLAQCFAINTAGTYALYTGPSATVPFTWAVNDQILVAGVFQLA